MDKKKDLINSEQLIYNRAFERTMRETDDVLSKLRNKQNYTEKESKVLVKEVAQNILPLDNQRKLINKTLKTTTDKSKRLNLLEDYHKVNSEIQSYWDKKNSEWSDGFKKLEEESENKK